MLRWNSSLFTVRHIHNPPTKHEKKGSTVSYDDSRHNSHYRTLRGASEGTETTCLPGKKESREKRGSLEMEIERFYLMLRHLQWFYNCAGPRHCRCNFVTQRGKKLSGNVDSSSLHELDRAELISRIDGIARIAAHRERESNVVCYATPHNRPTI